MASKSSPVGAVIKKGIMANCQKDLLHFGIYDCEIFITFI